MVIGEVSWGNILSLHGHWEIGDTSGPNFGRGTREKATVIFPSNLCLLVVVWPDRAVFIVIQKLVARYCGKMLEKGGERTGNWEAELGERQIECELCSSDPLQRWDQWHMAYLAAGHGPGGRRYSLLTWFTDVRTK